jgi:hypothetical protein
MSTIVVITPNMTRQKASDYCMTILARLAAEFIERHQGTEATHLGNSPFSWYAPAGRKKPLGAGLFNAVDLNVASGICGMGYA